MLHGFYFMCIMLVLNNKCEREMNVEEAKSLVDSGKVCVLDEEVIKMIPFINWKGYCTVGGHDESDDTFCLYDFYTDAHIGWYGVNSFTLLEFEYIDDYKLAVKESLDGKLVDIGKMLHY